MTKKLEDILNLPNVKEAFKKVDDKEKARESKEEGREIPKNVDAKTAAALKATYEEFDKIERALPQVKGGRIVRSRIGQTGRGSRRELQESNGPGHERGFTLFRTYI